MKLVYGITGSCVSELQADVYGAIESLEYYASLVTTSVGHHVKLENGDFAYVTKEPYGIVAGEVQIIPQCTIFDSVTPNNCTLSKEECCPISIRSKINFSLIHGQSKSVGVDFTHCMNG